jgi:hypothetical protein
VVTTCSGSASAWAFLLIIDFLFLSENTFIYDPSYAAWSARSGYGN